MSIDGLDQSHSRPALIWLLLLLRVRTLCGTTNRLFRCSRNRKIPCSSNLDRCARSTYDDASIQGDELHESQEMKVTKSDQSDRFLHGVS